MVSSAVNTSINLVDRLNQDDEVLFYVEVLEESPVITPIHYSPTLIAVITFGLVILFASGLLVVHTYLSGNDQTK